MGHPVKTAPKLDYAGLADELGVKVKTVRMWGGRGHLPAPDAVAGGSPMWNHSTLAPFIKRYRETGSPRADGKYPYRVGSKP